jgi:hypothetical protein
MLKMTLKKFFKTDIDEGRHELYILKRGSDVLYIGISERGVWNRWFGRMSGHMMRNIWGEFFPGSQAGRAVIENFPKSWQWTIELWTIQDCAEFLNIQAGNESIYLHHVEQLMIEKLQPSLNVMHARYNKDTSDLFDTSADQQKAHRKLYG